MKGIRPIWSNEQLHFLKSNFSSLSLKTIADSVGKSRAAVKSKSTVIGLRKGRVAFSEDDDFLIRKLYADTPGELIAFILNRPLHSIYGRANRLGIKKDEQYLLEQNRRLGTQLAYSEIAIKNRITKGSVPMNKGKKQSEYMTPEQIARSIPTRFKKGNKVHNEAQDGDVKIRHSHKKRNQKPYKWIRLAKGKWEMLHVHNWKKVHGTIPIGKIIVFKTGDTMNCDVSNLEMISLKDNMRRNSIQNYPEEIKKTIRTLSKLNKTLRKYEQY